MNKGTLTVKKWRAGFPEAGHCCYSIRKSRPTLCNPMDRNIPGFPVLHYLPELDSVMLSNHLILCHPLLLLPSIFPNIRIFSSELVLHTRWAKCGSFSFSISPSNDYSGLISFRIDWFDILGAQGTLRSLFWHHSSKTSIFQHSALFMVQLSHPYMTTGKTIAFTIWTFVSKVMSLLFHRLSMFIIAFLSRSKHLLISWL